MRPPTACRARSSPRPSRTSGRYNPYLLYFLLITSYVFFALVYSLCTSSDLLLFYFSPLLLALTSRPRSLSPLQDMALLMRNGLSALPPSTLAYARWFGAAGVCLPLLDVRNGHGAPMEPPMEPPH